MMNLPAAVMMGLLAEIMMSLASAITVALARHLCAQVQMRSGADGPGDAHPPAAQGGQRQRISQGGRAPPPLSRAPLLLSGPTE